MSTLTAHSMKSAEIRSRIEPDLKEGATRVLADCGLNLSDAIRLFLRQVVINNGLPFEIKVPNATTRAAMEEARSKTSLALTLLMNCMMTLKKQPNAKRANPPRNFTRTKELSYLFVLAHTQNFLSNR